MSFSDKMNAMNALEREIYRMVDSLKADLTSAVVDQPFHGEMINEGSNGGPLIGVVKLSQLSKSKNWSPDYHFPAAQAKAVSKRIESCKTSSDICSAVRGMIAEKRVRIGGGNYFVPLNEETLKILRESGIGQYVISGEIGN